MKLISWNVNGLRAVVGKDGFAWLDEIEPDLYSTTFPVVPSKSNKAMCQARFTTLALMRLAQTQESALDTQA